MLRRGGDWMWRQFREGRLDDRIIAGDAGALTTTPLHGEGGVPEPAPVLGGPTLLAAFGSRGLSMLRSEAGRAFLFILLAACLSRLVLLAIGEITLAAIAKTPDASLAGMAELFSRWDSKWYISIVEGGYRTTVPGGPAGLSNYAFSPLYPMVVAAIRAVTGWPTIVAGVVISNVFFLVALCLIRRYVRRLGLSEAVARMTILLICFAPQSLVFSAVYTESLFLMLTAASLVFLREDRLVAAGSAAALLGAVRPNGVFIIWFMLPYIIRREGFRALLPPWRKAEALIPLALAPAGLVLWWWYCYATTGDGFAQTSTEIHGWAWRMSEPFGNMVRFLVASPVEARVWAVVSLALFLSSFLLLRLRLYEEFIFCFANFMLSWSGFVAYSLIRFAIVLFPVFIGIAATTRGRQETGGIILAVFGSLSALLMVAWTLRNWLAT